MSKSKAAAAPDAEIPPNKLQPIYSALDSRNYKAALKEIGRVNEKYGNRHILSALQAVALERTGRRDEAMAVCRSVARDTPTDDTVINTLTITLRALDARTSLICFIKLTNYYGVAFMLTIPPPPPPPAPPPAPPTPPSFPSPLSL
jgi:hypothetical protein